jgi:hypothetical protein
MKTRKISLFGLFVMTVFVVSLFSTSVSAGIRDDEVQSEHIQEADGTSGQDTNSGSGIKSGHIQDGAVTSSIISDSAVTTSKMTDDSVTTNKSDGWFGNNK